MPEPRRPQPRMGEWRAHPRTYRGDWTGRGQGVATDGRSWFATSNDANPGLFRYSPDFARLEAHAPIPRSIAGHVGAVSVWEGTVYVALEHPQQVATFATDLTDRRLLPIVRPVEADGMQHLAWCAINPGNGLLYSCDWNHATRLDAYDPATGSPRPAADIALDSSVHRTQGAVFSPAGGVYLASDEHLTLPEQLRRWFGFGRRGIDERPLYPGIHGFEVSTGRKLGYLRVPTRPFLPHFEEIEGIGLGPMTVGGTLTHVHLTMLEKNHSWVDDDMHVLSYAVPDPTAL